MPRGDLYLFESAFSADAFDRKIGRPKGLIRIVHNGVTAAEFESVVPAADATDLIFMGELRALKGVDLLIDAIAMLRRDGRSLSATIVGAGPDQAQFHQQVERLKLADRIHFRPPMPARQAQELGRIMVMPSRMESFPYVVLEAAAAGKPLLATRVGGIPEIYGPLADALVPADDAAALARAIAAAIDSPTPEATAKLRDRVAASFTAERMVDGVISAYAAAIDGLSKAGRR
jgi:glycosyltransferase involved in cell wall biosynthesis